MTNIALQLYTIKSETEKDLLGALKTVAEIGYDGVEFAGFFDVPTKEIRAVLDDHDLKGVGAHFIIDLLESNLDTILEDAHTLGLPTIGCPGFWGVDYEQESTFHQFARRFNTIGEKCKSSGLNFIYHIHGHEFVRFGDKTGMDILIEETAPEHMSLQPDIFWVQRAGVDPAEFVRKHGSRIMQLHMKDAQDESWHDIEVGDGIVDTRGVLDVARTLPIDWLIVEQEAFDKPLFESITISLKNLRSMTGESTTAR